MLAVFVESYIIFMCHVTTSSHYRQLVSVYQSNWSGLRQITSSDHETNFNHKFFGRRFLFQSSLGRLKTELPGRACRSSGEKGGEIAKEPLSIKREQRHY